MSFSTSFIQIDKVPSYDDNTKPFENISIYNIGF